MPTFCYICDDCGYRFEEFVDSFTKKRRGEPCTKCGEAMREDFMQNRPGAMIFQPYFDEALDCDVNGSREKKQILAAEGLQEVGDRVGGARDFDESAPHHVGMKAPQGRRHADVVRERETGRKEAADWEIATKNADGTQSVHNTEDLPSA